MGNLGELGAGWGGGAEPSSCACGWEFGKSASGFNFSVPGCEGLGLTHHLQVDLKDEQNSLKFDMRYEGITSWWLLHCFHLCTSPAGWRKGQVCCRDCVLETVNVQSSVVSWKVCPGPRSLPTTKLSGSLFLTQQIQVLLVFSGSMVGCFFWSFGWVSNSDSQPVWGSPPHTEFTECFTVSFSLQLWSSRIPWLALADFHDFCAIQL